MAPFSLHDLYLKLPPALQHAACSVEGWRISRDRYGTGYAAVAADVQERGRWNHERVADYRDRRLREFVKYASRTVSHYRALFRRLRIDAGDIRTLEDLRALPVLTKAEVQADLASFTASTVAPRERRQAHTGGTTGSGLRFTTTVTAEQEQWAVWWRYRGWHGIAPEAWCGVFGGRVIAPADQAGPPFWRYNVPARQVLFSGQHLSERFLPTYIEELRTLQLPWLHGYPSLLALLAGWIVDRGIDLGYEIRHVTTGSETLLPSQAKVIERAFGVRPRQHYGLAEATANLSQCGHGRLHVDEDFAAVELLPVEDSDAVRIVGTNVSNAATPLLRYDSGDLGVPYSADCECGRSGRVLTAIDGRRDDYVVLRDGSRLGRLAMFKDLVNIRETQVYNPAPGEVVFRVVRSDGWTADDQSKLLAEAKARFGDRARVSVEYLERLPRTGRGKLRLVVSDVAPLDAGGSEDDLETGAPVLSQR